jgi:hypothetical protein
MDGDYETTKQTAYGADWWEVRLSISFKVKSGAKIVKPLKWRGRVPIIRL